MNQTLLFLIGSAVFAVTLVGVMLYGYATFNRSYQADVESELPDTHAPLTGIDGLPLIAGGAAPVVSPTAS